MSQPIGSLTRRGLLAGLGAMSALGAPALATPVRRPTAGVALGLFASVADWDYGPLLDEIVTLGTREVLLVVPLYQRDVRATQMERRPGASPSHATVARTLGQARDRGLRVGLMPLVRLTRRVPTEWRGVLAPTDVSAWFDAWEAVVDSHALLAARYGADRLVVGTEFASLEGHEARWRGLIQRLRRRFSGRLVYSANWDRYRELPFWDALDEIGVTGYFRLAAPGVRPTRAAVGALWEPLMDGLQALGQVHGKPVLLTEVGWPALPTAASHPWDDTRPGRPDPALQATLWAGFLDCVRSRGDLGFYAWNWFGLGQPGSTDHALRGQPAAEVLRAHFRATARP